MSVINVLDESTINKIAAGEVVERPVNVVKELTENAIDAGSTAISIEIKGGGIDHIRITDNGSGIEHESIPTAFIRHATSKIGSIEDLLSLSSLGFRGEALSSIAAVARVELITKTKDCPVGYRYCIEGGREMSFDEAGVPDGTTVIVKDLFYNTPARRKFLKSAATEGNLVTELVERLILSHPDISFKYVVNGTLKLTSNGLSDIMSDLYSVFGRDVQKSLSEVSFESEECTIKGYVGKPEIARGNRNSEIFFVNNRYIKSNVLSSALEEAFRPFLMQHRFPFCVLYLYIPSKSLDVNIHPSKTEIRFCEERYVYSCVMEAVTEAVTRKELIPEGKITFEKTETEKDEKDQRPLARSYDIPEPFETVRREEYSKKEIGKIEKDQAVCEEEPVQETLFKEGLISVQNKPKHKMIGQVFDTYWIVEYEGRMYMIDQHAAHEKVIYERLSSQIASDRVMSQMISPPYIVSLSVAEENAVLNNMASFEELGFSIEHFGGREYAITSVPVELFRLGEQEYFKSVVDDLMENSRVREPSEVKDRIATMACKAAIKGNMHMTFAEADALIDELLSLDNPYNCPHGRPVIISFSQSELEKMFKRIV